MNGAGEVISAVDDSGGRDEDRRDLKWAGFALLVGQEPPEEQASGLVAEFAEKILTNWRMNRIAMCEV